MDSSKIIDIIAYTIPAIVTAGVAYYFFDAYFKDQRNTRRWLLAKENKKEILPLRLQAYERMTLFLERISLGQILVRIAPISANKFDYITHIVLQVEQEFEHNLSQQIYISGQCWSLISTAKNATLQLLREAGADETIANADQLRERLLQNLVDKSSPSNAALIFLKDEVAQLW